MSFDSFSSTLFRAPELGFSLDTSLMEVPSKYCDEMADRIAKAFSEMRALEAGAIANPDEDRMVGHYWLRNPDLAPTDELREAIVQPRNRLREFAARVVARDICPPGGGAFDQLLVIGIGGSALGPQFVYDALRGHTEMRTFFFDNTDPAGIDRTLAEVGDLSRTLTLVISKSGGTPETRNGMLEAKAAYEAAGLDFGRFAVAVTGDGSKLDRFADEHKWLARFPMEDWVGGRTSIMSTVGLVPMALQGFDIESFLNGAAAMDDLTRRQNLEENPAMKLALAWHHEGNGRGEKDMVVIPYKDSLALFSKYLQQLIMESLGKRLDLDGKEVHQGIAVYGNKGSTDQHAYVQQLRDGLPNFFATFIEVREGREGESIAVDEEGFTSADYLQGFLRGTRKALAESGRHSLTLSIEKVTPHSLGALIALYERAVGFYASLVNVNAYHQPGVEAGKKAAGEFLTLLGRVKAALTDEARSAPAIASDLEADPEAVYHCLTHLAANGGAQHRRGDAPVDDTFSQ